jgi:hypothetical protein
MPSLAPAFILLGSPFDRWRLLGLVVGCLFAFVAMGALLLGGLDDVRPDLVGSWRWLLRSDFA